MKVGTSAGRIKTDFILTYSWRQLWGPVEKYISVPVHVVEADVGKIHVFKAFLEHQNYTSDRARSEEGSWLAKKKRHVELSLWFETGSEIW